MSIMGVTSCRISTALTKSLCVCVCVCVCACVRACVRVCVSCVRAIMGVALSEYACVYVIIEVRLQS